MLATSVHGSQSMADRVLGMCSVPKPPGAGWSALARTTLWLWSKLGSSHKQVSTAAALACGGVQHDLAPTYAQCAWTPWYLLYQIAPHLVCCARTLYPCYSQNKLAATKSVQGWRKHDLSCRACAWTPCSNVALIAPELVGCCKNPVITPARPSPQQLLPQPCVKYT
jgi:hypothetical protein